MAKKEEELIPEPIQDPFILMKQRDDMIMTRLDTLENAIGNLQETWDRILNVAQEQPLRRQYQQYPQYPQYQQSYQQPYEQSFQQPLQTPIDSNVPKWEREQVVEKPKAKRKLGRGMLLIVIAAVLIVAVYMFFMSKGYSCNMPGR